MKNEVVEKDRKAGILTFYNQNYNFGGLLQAYALPTALKKYLGVSAEQIDFNYGSKLKNKEKEKVSLYNIIYKSGIAFFRFITSKKLKNRKKVFDRFIKEIPHSEREYDCNNISNALKEYNIFICGGDQIWNDCNEKQNLEAFTLQFVPDCVKKIAYAPSMAVLETGADFKKSMVGGLSGLNAVSVREKRSLEVLQPLTDKKIEVVVDPALLLTEKDWDNILTEQKPKGKYILCYLLGDSNEQRDAVKKLSKNIGLPIWTFPNIFCNVVRKCDLFFGDIKDYSSGPREFLGLIKNADMVITDSFHACVFSMIFKTPFTVFERGKSGEKGNMNSRIYDFLEEYCLENQLVSEKTLTEMKEIPKIDFTYAHEHWKKRREESLEYLKNALKED